jgi:fructose-specific phosphotransferase system IIC component
MRTTVPIFTIMIYRIWFSRSYSTSTYQSLVPIIVGAGLTTINEYRFTDAGFLITLLGVILAAVKVHILPSS